jgi:hypothetical protein
MKYSVNAQTKIVKIRELTSAEQAQRGADAAEGEADKLITAARGTREDAVEALLDAVGKDPSADPRITAYIDKKRPTLPS